MRDNVVWAIGDQAVTSLGAFALQLLTARALSPAEFGAFVLIYGLLMAAYVVNGALVFYPVTLQVAAAGREAMRRLAGSAVTQAVALSLPWTAMILGAAWYLERLDAVPAAVAALVAWQAHESLRRILMADLNHRRALLGDGLATSGHIVVIAGLSTGGYLSVTTAFLGMAFNYALAFLVQARYLRPEVGPAALQSVGANMKTGRWMFATELAGIGITQLPPWALAVVSGPAAAGAFGAVLNVLKMSHPALYGIYYLIITVVAKERSAASVPRTRTKTVRLGLVLAAVVFPFYIAAALWPAWMLRILYGLETDYGRYTSAIPVLVVAYCLMTVSYVAAAWLNGMELSHLVMRANLLAFAVGLAAVWSLAARYQVVGAAASVVVMQAIATANMLYFAVRWRAGTSTLKNPDEARDSLGMASP